MFDQDTVLGFGRVLNRDAFNVDEDTLVDFYNTGQPIPINSMIGDGTGVRTSDFYGKEAAFQGVRMIRLGFKLTF